LIEGDCDLVLHHQAYYHQASAVWFHEVLFGIMISDQLEVGKFFSMVFCTELTYWSDCLFCFTLSQSWLMESFLAM